MQRSIIQITKAFFAVLLILLVLLLAASAIPNQWLEKRQSEALEVLDLEGWHPQPFFDSIAAEQDNYTDIIIMEQTLNAEEDSVFESAMHPSYARYWHGYCVFLRPLLTVFSLYQIRYGMMLLFFILFGTTAILIANRIDVPSAIAFTAANAMAFLLVVATSLQFFPTFLISYLAIIAELLFADRVRKNHLVFFLVVGMMTSFIDLLTTPLLTLGLPLIVYLLADDETTGAAGRLRSVVSNSALWGIGYGAMWASKWLIGSLILRKNVLKNASEAMAFRLKGNEDYAGGLLVDRIYAVLINAKTMFLAEDKRAAVVLVLVLIILIAVAVWRRTKDVQKRWQALAVLAVGVFPYVWYFVLSNHSLIHTFFTFRAQVVSVFALLACLGRLTEFRGNKMIREQSHG